MPASSRRRLWLVSDDAATPELLIPRVDHSAIGPRLDEERRRASLLGDVREAIFGAQDGLVSTLAVVSTVSGATDNRLTVLIAGIATGLAGIFSMAAGEFLSSKSQREIALAHIAEEREKVAGRRDEVQAELAYMLAEDGLPEADAGQVAATIAGHPEVLLNSKVEKAFGIAVEEAHGSPLQGAVVMGFVPIRSHRASRSCSSGRSPVWSATSSGASSRPCSAHPQSAAEARA